MSNAKNIPTENKINLKNLGKKSSYCADIA
jgi:hypothetical protein